MAVAEVAHVDQRAVGRLERVARVELGDAVGADHLPVGAAGQHAPGKPLAAEAAAGDRDDAAAAERRVAQLLRRRERDLSPEERLGASSDFRSRKSSRKARGGLPSFCSRARVADQRAQLLQVGAGVGGDDSR